MNKRAFIDTNILIDLFARDRPYHSDARKLLADASYYDVQLGVCAMSLKDAYYVLCKRMHEGEVRELIRQTLKLIDVVSVDRAIVKTAVESDEADFEDGIVRACAERFKADYIISRDEKAYGRSRIKRVTAGEYLGICAG